MGSCYIYQPRYLGAAQSRTNGLPIGDAITGSVGGGAGVVRGDGDPVRFTSPGGHPQPLLRGTAVLEAAATEGAPGFSSPPLTGRSYPESSVRGHPSHPPASPSGQSLP